MSIYSTWLTIEDDRQVQASMAAEGIRYEVVGGPIRRDAPLVYRGSHVLPSGRDPRGGYVHVSAIPDHVQREGRRPPYDYLRLSVSEDVVGDNDATVVLTRRQVVELRDVLTTWLESRPRE